MFSPRLLTLRTSFAFMLLLLAIASVIAGHPFQALAGRPGQEAVARRSEEGMSEFPPLPP